MNVTSITVGAFEVNCWVVATSASTAIVIDPGADAQIIDAFLNARHYKIQAYLLTHGHMDHVSALATLSKTHTAPIYIHPDDATWAFTSANQIPPYYPPPEAPPKDLVLPNLIETGDFKNFGFEIIETPGHTPGSVCIYFNGQNMLFTGDTLVAGSVGTTDFPGGNPADLQKSLQRLKSLPANTVLYPGHGPTSTLSDELRTNPFF